MPNQAIGYGLLGVLQGVEAAKNRDIELQHRKELLKLEQDKVKIAEKESELNAGARLKNAMADLARSQQPTFGGPGQVPYIGGVPGPQIPFAPQPPTLVPPENVLLGGAPGPGGKLPEIGRGLPSAAGKGNVSTKVQLIDKVAKDLKISQAEAVWIVLGGGESAVVDRTVQALLRNALVNPKTIKTDMASIVATAKQYYKDVFAKKAADQGAITEDDDLVNDLLEGLAP